jgi:thymidylate kinase
VAWINVFLDGEGVLERGRGGRFGEGCLHPSNDDVVLITLAHAIYEDKQITIRDLFHVREALRSGIDLEQIQELSRRHGWERGWVLGRQLVSNAASALNVDSHETWGSFLLPARGSRKRSTVPLGLSKIYGKSLHFQKTWADQTTSVQEKAKESLRLAQFAALVKSGPLRRSTSVLISLSGQDGSGKSTVARTAVNQVKPFTVTARYHWIRLGSSPFLEAIKSLLGEMGNGMRREMKTALPGQMNMSRGGLRHQDLLKEAWCWVLLLDFLIRAWSDTIEARMRGGIQVFDRYTVDAQVDLAVKYAFRPHPLIERLGPKPDLAVLLQIAAPIARSRSETPATELESQQANLLYTKLEGLFDLVLDADTASATDIAVTVAGLALDIAEDRTGILPSAREREQSAFRRGLAS